MDTADGLTGSSGGAVGYTLDGFSLDLADFTGVAFSSDALPTSLSLADFPDVTSITLSFLTSDGFTVNNAIYGITSLSFSGGPGPGEMPVPATLALLSLALIGLGFSCRRYGR